MEVCILNTQDIVKAELAQATLESNGIPSELRTNDASGTLPQLRFSQGIQLFVSKEDEQKSKEILKQEGLI